MLFGSCLLNRGWMGAVGLDIWIREVDRQRR